MGKEVQTVFNLLSEGIRVEGDIQTPSDIRIDGTLVGSVQTEGKLVLGPEAQVKGELKSQSIDIFGRVEGNIECSGTVVVRANAHVQGSIKMETLIVELGAIFEGSSEMMVSSEHTIQPENPKKK